MGIVTAILRERPGIKEIQANCDGQIIKAAAYTDMVGEIRVGDHVLLNQTAEVLHLGSGGYDFVMVNLDAPQTALSGPGHIMKMRYTPWQCQVFSAEEEGSPYRDDIISTETLDGLPVLVGTLHSMLGPLAAVLTEAGMKTAYVMTDAAALPIAWSRNAAELKEKQMIAGTVTTGNAIGGDLETVNIFSGLLAAQAVFKPDAVIVTMGPGIVGTGTKWGFSGVEQGVVLNAVHSLGGLPITVPRISFADARQRHQGISHHTMTVLEQVCLIRSILPLPELEETRMRQILAQLDQHDAAKKHEIIIRSGDQVLPAMERCGISVTTMGRGAEADREFFLALGAAAQIAAEYASKRRQG